MCPTQVSAVASSEGKIKKLENQPALESLPDRKLNHAAIEFISSNSDSEEASSESEDPQLCDTFEKVSSVQRKGMTENTHAGYMVNQGRDYDGQGRHRNYGWESPQGVLPSQMPYMAAPPMYATTSLPPPPSGGATEGGNTSDTLRDGDGLPHIAPPRRISAGSPPPQMMMPQYSWGHPPYPLYHVSYPQGQESMGASIHRSSSPPAVYPAGGSPPLAPGFISVPVQGHMDPGSPTSHHMHHPGMAMYHPGSSPPHSLGSSPPLGSSGGHGPYMYAMHHPGMDYQQHHNHHHHMASMSLGPAGSSGGSSPGARNGQNGSSRASARIARSHRAGGAYNASEFVFSVDETESTGKTTVMIRNIPNKYSQDFLLGLLEAAGLNGSFDFFYLPVDFRNRCGLGYAFVNFVSFSAAVKAYKHFHNHRWDEFTGDFNSRKVCQVSYARVQGRDALVQHFKTAKFPSSDPEFCPLVYSTTPGTEEEGGGGAHSPLPIHAHLEMIGGVEDAAAVVENVEVVQVVA